MKYETFMRFPQGKLKAFTLSYDDGVAADRHLMQILHDYAVKCTFNLNSDLFDRQDWHNRLPEKDVLALFGSCPHEIALHGHRHLFMSKCPPVQMYHEIVANRTYLEKAFGRVVNGMAYAYGDVSEQIEDACRACGVVYARTTKSTHDFTVPTDFLCWNPTCHHGDGELPALADAFVSTSPAHSVKFREPFLFYVWGHSYEFDDHDNWQVLTNLLDKVALRNDVWYATNGEIYSYVTAFRSLIWSADGSMVYNPTCTDVWLERDGITLHVPSGSTVKVD